MQHTNEPLENSNKNGDESQTRNYERKTLLWYYSIIPVRVFSLIQILIALAILLGATRHFAEK